MDERRISVACRLVLCLCGLSILSVGCSLNSGARKVATSREVSLGEFAEPQTSAGDGTNTDALDELLASSQHNGVTAGAGQSGAAIDGNDTNGGGGAADDETTIASDIAPPERSERRLQPGDGVIVDSLIGQVNGRPIFADEFFTPIEDELIAQSKQLNRQQFIQQASSIVTRHLEEVVMNELFLAEAEAGLTQEQQRGLFGFMKQFQEQTIAKSGGLESQKRQELGAEGVTLEEYIEAEKNKRLIQNLIMQKIRPRVIVSWRDVEREYERRRNEFNPPARVTLSRISLNNERDADRIADVKKRLDAGESFEDIAASLGIENGGVWQTFNTDAGGVDGIALKEDIRKNLEGLHEGDTSRPFAVGSSTWWLHIAKVEQPPARDIYDPDVQRSLTEYLISVRFNEQFLHYRQTLFQHGIYDELNDMRDRLLAIAIVRYGP